MKWRTEEEELIAENETGSRNREETKLVNGAKVIIRGLDSKG